MNTPQQSVAVALAVASFAGCASPRFTSEGRLQREMAIADAAYRSLRPGHVTGYNAAVASISRQMDGETAPDFHSQLASMGVEVDEPAVKLPLAHYHVVLRGQIPNDPYALGVPMVLEYDTQHAPLYPREGLFVSATAIYHRMHGRPHVSLVRGQRSLKLNGFTYPLAVDNVAPELTLSRRARRILRSGFQNMLRPARMGEEPQIFLLDPYDPNKIPLLMIHGLQTTPIEFLSMINALRSDPEIAQHFQTWHFFYATDLPDLVNALVLRNELANTIHTVDPHDHDFATRHIVVLGHSMGGLLAHTLVSSTGNRIWASIFVVPPKRLRGDPKAIQEFKDAFFFRRNPRVIRVIFMATPHRGSALADTWLGAIAKSLIRLPPTLQTGFTDIVEENPGATTPGGTAFNKQLNFSSVHTLSPHDPALLALAQLPIAVPFHNIIGQLRPGPVETGSDGVVTYTSAHLDGAASELVVRSGHNIADNPEAQREVIRILRLELNSVTKSRE